MTGGRVIEKRVLLTAEEAELLECFLQRLRVELRCSVRLSHVLRAFVRRLIAAEQAIVDRARQTEGLKRPPNGAEQLLIDFEDDVSDIVFGATRPEVSSSMHEVSTSIVSGGILGVVPVFM